MLQPYFKMDQNVFFPSAIYTKYPIMTKQKQFRHFCKCIQNKKQTPLHKYSDPLLWDSIELRCILFPLIILEMFLQLDWSLSVVNSIDWTLFGKAYTCLYKGPTVDGACQRKNQAMRSKELSVELRDRIVSSHRSGEGYQKMSAALKVPKNTEDSILKLKKFGTTKDFS